MISLYPCNSSALVEMSAGLDLPEKGGVLRIVSKMPFASAEHDPAFLLDRRNGLEKYLQVCDRSAILLH